MTFAGYKNIQLCQANIDYSKMNKTIIFSSAAILKLFPYLAMKITLYDNTINTSGDG